MVGSTKSFPGTRSGPRSRPTTVRPALVNSRARIEPVQPMPTMTASTSFKRVAMAIAPSRKVGDRLWLDEIAPVAILIDAVGVERRQARIADHLPGGLVAIAAIDWISQEAFHHQVDERIEELPAIEIAELGLAALERLERVLALLRAEPMEVLAMNLAHPIVGCCDADTDEL